MKPLESLEIMIYENGGDRRRFGPFEYSFPEDLPFDDRSSWKIILKANGGYGKNHETGMTVVSNWKGELREILSVVEMALINYGRGTKKHEDES